MSFGIALYVRAHDLIALNGDVGEFETAFDRLSQSVGFSKVYLETCRDLAMVPATVLRDVKARLEARGVSVAGGVTVTINEQDDFRTFCYSNSVYRDKLVEIVTFSLTVFDELLFDDFFFTNCKCPLCIEKKGARTWAQFRLEAMLDASKTLVLETARRVNPRAQVVIKYPNWYEHFQGLGFNLKDQPPLYDGIYSGNETRDSHLNNQHLQPYQSYLVTRYYEAIAPGKNRGGWVDPFGAGFEYRYPEQITATLLAKARELTLFDFSNLVRLPQAPVLAGETMGALRRPLEALGEPIGVKAYKPFHSSGEDFLHNYLGMIGLPIDLVPEYPSDDALVLLTASAADDPEVLGKLKADLAKGRDRVLTYGFVRRLGFDKFAEVVSIQDEGRKTLIDEFMIGWEPIAYPARHPILFSNPHTYTNDVWEIACGVRGAAGAPFLQSASYSQGKVYLLNVPDSFADLYALPSAILDCLRGIVCRHLPVRLEGFPAEVALFLYDNGALAVHNFTGGRVRGSLVSAQHEREVELEPHQTRIYATILAAPVL